VLAFVAVLAAAVGEELALSILRPPPGAFWTPSRVSPSENARFGSFMEEHVSSPDDGSSEKAL
jgi:hypothetical protein